MACVFMTGLRVKEAEGRIRKDPTDSDSFILSVTIEPIAFSNSENIAIEYSYSNS